MGAAGGWSDLALHRITVGAHGSVAAWVTVHRHELWMRRPHHLARVHGVGVGRAEAADAQSLRMAALVHAGLVGHHRVRPALRLGVMARWRLWKGLRMARRQGLSRW